MKNNNLKTNITNNLYKIANHNTTSQNTMKVFVGDLNACIKVLDNNIQHNDNVRHNDNDSNFLTKGIIDIISILKDNVRNHNQIVEQSTTLTQLNFIQLINKWRENKMKKFIYPVIVAITLIFATTELFTKPVDLETAKRIGANFLQQPINDKKIGNSFQSTNEPYYILHSDSGFVIISSDDAVNPIIGYSHNNPIDKDELPPNMKAWLDSRAEQIRYVIRNNIPATNEVKQEWQELQTGKKSVNKFSAGSVEPLIRTRWNQNNNSLTPSNSPTGCIATAMAQIMKYWEYPKQGIDSHCYIGKVPNTLNYQVKLCAYFKNTTYKWKDMVYNDDKNCLFIDTLMYHCGVSVEMFYTKTGSGASLLGAVSISNMQPVGTPSSFVAFPKYFGYIKDSLKPISRFKYINNGNSTQPAYTTAQWVEILKTELYKNRPIMYAGGAHAFICDGYDIDNYFHFNWGWGGLYDGYFNIDRLSPGKGGTGAGSGEYNDYEQIIIGIVSPNGLISQVPLCSLTVNKNITSGGTVTIGGTNSSTSTIQKDSGSVVTITATPATCYSFVNWTNADGTQLSTANPLTITMTKDSTLRANFVRDSFNLTLNGNPTAGGTISGTSAGKKNCNTTVSVTATANTGYTFVNWTADDGVEVSKNAAYSFQIRKDITLTANFQSTTSTNYTLTLTTNPTTGAGTVTGGGIYASGTKVPIEAASATCYKFVNWTNANGTVTHTYKQKDTITITKNDTLRANFERITYTVDVNSGTGGNATKTPNTATVNCGDSVIFTAIPNSCYKFVNWTNANGTVTSNTNPLKIAINANTTLTANFVKDSFNLTLNRNPIAGGTISGTSAGKKDCNSNISVTATPNTGYTFVNWTADGIEVSTNAAYTFQITKDITLTANFQSTALPTYTLTLTTNPTTGAGTVTGGGTYTSGTKVVIEAIPATCYKFVNWTNANGRATHTYKQKDTITITKNDTLRANFGRITYTVGVNAGTGGSAAKTPNTATVNCGDSVTFTATPNSCYKFVNWTNANGTVISNTNPLKIAINDNTNLVANFVRDSFNLTVNANTGGTVSPSGTSKQDCNSYVTIIATANTGYSFVNWIANGVEVSTNAAYTFQITKDITLAANFQPIALPTYTLTLTTNPTTDAGTVTGEGIYDSGTKVPIEAIPATCYKFVNWTNANGTVTHTYKQKDTITITKNDTLRANFERITYAVNVISGKGGSAAKTPNTATINCGDNVTFTATPNTDYIFVNWTNANGNVISTENPLTVAPTSDITLIANFETTSTITTYTLRVIASNGGTVTKDDISNNDNSKTLFAIPNTGYHFVNWTSADNVISTNVISTENPLTVTLVSDTTLVANFEVNKGNRIINAIKSGTVSILPNPANEYFILSFDVIKSSDIKIVLMDLSGRELSEIYYGFVTEGLFTKIVKTTNLGKGVYFIKIFTNGNNIIEKVTLE